MEHEKELLLKDLCARLPYKPQVEIIKDGTSITDKLTTATIKYLEGGYWDVKPYLFPFSSMNDEDKFEFRKLTVDYDNKESMGNFMFRYEELLEELEMIGFFPYEIYDWLNKNHFDYRGLIKKGLAIDCTNLNIY